jgi:hypothetical protein
MVGIAVLTGSQLLLGAPQALSYSLFTVALFAVFLAWHRRPTWTFWPSWLAANLLGVAIGGVQVLATRALLTQSTRGGFDPLLGSLMPSQLAHLLAPDLLSNHLPYLACSEPLYFGAVPLILALWWIASLRRRGTVSVTGADEPLEEGAANQLGFFALVLGVLSAWLALGKNGYLYYLQTSLPLVGQFRLPGRYFTLVALATSLLAAVACHRLLTDVRLRRQASWRQLCLPWAGVAVALLLALALRIAYPKENGSSIHRNYFAGPLFLGGAALALTTAARGRMLGLYALVALAVTDIEVFSLKAPFWPRESLWGGLPTLTEFCERAEAPPRPVAGRWLEDAFEVPHPLLFNQSVLQGYHGGLEPMKRLDYHTLAALRVANTAWHHLSRYDDKPVSLPGLRRVRERWYEVPDPLPRVRLVSHIQVSQTPATDIEKIDLKSTALVAHSLDLEAGEPGTAELIAEQSGELCVHVTAPGRQLLVIADSFDPSWSVFVDGQSAPIERVNGDFLGCRIEAGTHEVHFVFRPASIYYGRILSLSGLGIALLLAAGSIWQALSQSRRAADDPGPAQPCE